MKTSLENIIKEYFKLVNPLPYQSFELKLLEPSEIIIITIHVGKYSQTWPYYQRKGDCWTTTESIVLEMGEMFPYDFKIVCKSNAPF